MSATDVIYDDSNVDQMGAISPDASHRDVDAAIVQADTERLSFANIPSEHD